MDNWSLTKAQDSTVEKNSLFNKWCWNNWIFTCTKMNLDPYLTLHTKIELLWLWWLCGLGVIPIDRKVAGFYSRWGHMPGFLARSPVGGVWEATNQSFYHTSLFLSFSFSLPSLISKNKEIKSFLKIDSKWIRNINIEI